MQNTQNKVLQHCTQVEAPKLNLRHCELASFIRKQWHKTFFGIKDTNVCRNIGWLFLKQTKHDLIRGASWLSKNYVNRGQGNSTGPNVIKLFPSAIYEFLK